MIKRALLLIVPIFLSVVCSSCISVERFVKLNSDGSGEEELKMTFQREFYSMMGTFAMMFDSTGTQSGLMDSMYNVSSDLTKLREQFNSTEGVRLIDSYSEIQPDSSNMVYVKYAFDNVSRIGESMNKVNEDLEDQPSKVMFTEEGGNVVFRYVYENADTSMSEMNDSAKSEMMAGIAGMFSGGKFRFELEAPYEIVSSNATVQTGRKLVWDLPMSKLISESKLILEAVMKPN